MKRRSNLYLENLSNTVEDWNNLEKDILESVRYEDGYNPWSIDPITFDEFCISKVHMDFPNLSDKQKDPLHALLGTDSKKMFEDPEFDISVIIAGKGSGKDTIAALFLCYIIYIVLCLKNPQRYFFSNEEGQYPKNAKIDIVNVARSAAQASRVFFEYFKTFILGWRWLKNNYDVKLSGKSYSQAEKEGDLLEDKINICSDSVVFPKGIRAFSLHSDQETSEGLNVLAYVLDEFAAFKDKTQIANADKVFDVFNSSAKTRFPKKYKGILISYPRHKKDPIMKKAEEIKEGVLKRAFFTIGATWEFNPTKYKEDFSEDYERNPEMARCMYECIPPEQEDAFISFPERIIECITSHQPIAIYEDNIIKDSFGKEYISKRFVHANIHRQNDSIIYKATIDLGKSFDSAVINVGHLYDNTIIQDLIVEWIPDSKLKRPVDYSNVYDTLIFLKNNYINILEVYCDHWNSMDILQRLSKNNILAQEYSIKLDDWIGFRECLYSRQINLLNFTRQTDQIKRLKLIEGKKVDHPLGEHDDIAITTCGLFKIFKGKIKKDSKGRYNNIGMEGSHEDQYGTFEGDTENIGGIGTLFKH